MTHFSGSFFPASNSAKKIFALGDLLRFNADRRRTSRQPTRTANLFMKSRLIRSWNRFTSVAKDKTERNETVCFRNGGWESDVWLSQSAGARALRELRSRRFSPSALSTFCLRCRHRFLRTSSPRPDKTVTRGCFLFGVFLFSTENMYQQLCLLQRSESRCYRSDL